MARLLTAELLLVVATALFAAVGFPWLSGQPPAWPLLTVGFMMALAFVALYALANLAARRLRQPVLLAVGLVALALLVVAAPGGPASSPVSGELGSAPPGDLGASPPGWVLAAAGLILAVLGQLLGRGSGAGLYAFAVPLLAVRYVLVPLAGSGGFVHALAMQSGALYFFARGLVRLAFPTSAEGNLSAGPLVHRPVPDRIVGLVEATCRRRALPYATREDGSRDEGAIAVRCHREEVGDLAERLRAALKDHPVAMEPGLRIGDEVELVIRMNADASKPR